MITAMAEEAINQGQTGQGDAAPGRAPSPGRVTSDARAAIALPRAAFDRNVWCVMGLPVDAVNIDSAVGLLDRAIDENRRLSFVTPNVNWLVRASQDAVARTEILAADLSLADGAPLALMAKWLGVPVKGRVAGSDLFEAMRRRPPFSGRKASVFFFGGRDEAAQAAAQSLDEENSGLRSAGWHNPGFGDIEAMSQQRVIDEINAASPDFIVVALGAAKGQAWIERNKNRLTAPVIAHLGAVVDFSAGTISRAPKWVQNAGFEWAWRIKEEPGLWRRYWSDGKALAGLVYRSFLPSYLALRRQKNRGGAVIEPVSGEAGAVYRFAGDFMQEGLGETRRCFQRAVADRGDVVIDLSGVGRIDMAFLGQLLMLEKTLADQARTLVITGANPVHKTLLSANGICYRETTRAALSGEQARVAAAQ